MTTPTSEKVFPADERLRLPRPFILRRLHSLLGVWLVLYLFQHLLVNSQAALFFHDDGHGFVSMVNKIHNLPYLMLIELAFLGIPFVIHGLWGAKYALTSEYNSNKTDGTKPALPQYRRNYAFTWERITAWILLFGILAHVIHMRFLEYPTKIVHGEGRLYLMPMKYDEGLPLTAEKLGIRLYDQKQIEEKTKELKHMQEKLIGLEKDKASYEPDNPYFHLLNRIDEEKEWLQAAQKKPLKRGQVLGVAHNAGASFFLILRQTFKNPSMVVLYSILVIATSFHAFNGLWTFMITWGITLTRRSQMTMRRITAVLMWIVMFMGLAAAWGTYWTTLFQ